MDQLAFKYGLGPVKSRKRRSNTATWCGSRSPIFQYSTGCGRAQVRNVTSSRTQTVSQERLSFEIRRPIHCRNGVSRYTLASHELTHRGNSSNDPSLQRGLWGRLAGPFSPTALVAWLPARCAGRDKAVSGRPDPLGTGE